jgi:hypothetical protein
MRAYERVADVEKDDAGARDKRLIACSARHDEESSRQSL